MNVVIDIGNTLTKVASFDNDRLIDVYRLNDDEVLGTIGDPESVLHNI